MSYASPVAPPVDWSEHRQPNMLPLAPGRVLLWVVLAEVSIVVVVIAIFGNPHTSVAASVAVSVALASIPAGGVAHAIRRRKPPLRFGIPATALIVTIVWGVVAFALFVRTYQAY